MSKFINIFLIVSVASMGAFHVHGVTTNQQIQELLSEKQQKIAALEKCTGKKKGWMIAGVSTIGLTAAGVVGNVVLANANKRTENELASERQVLRDKKQPLSIDVPRREIGEVLHDSLSEEEFENLSLRECIAHGGMKLDPESADCIHAHHANSICGKIIDDTKEPVPFATIECIYEYKGEEYEYNAATSDFNGEYCIEQSIPYGAKCTARCIGYNPVVGTIDELVKNSDFLMCSGAINLETTTKFSDKDCTNI